MEISIDLGNDSGNGLGNISGNALGTYLLPLATIDLVGDNREIQD